jgi:hypothetical protein
LSLREKKWQLRFDPCIPLDLDYIHILTENGPGLEHTHPRVALDLQLLSKLSSQVSPVKDRLVVHNIGQRSTFADFFAYANNHIQTGDITIVANADIYFDATLQILKKGEVHKLDGKGIAIRPLVDMNKKVFALLRWDVVVNQTTGSRSLVYHPRSDCQDSWIFQVPLPPLHDRCDFVMGRLRCDNRYCTNV